MIMKTLKINVSIEQIQKPPFVGQYEIQKENINTFLDVKTLAVKWWREEKEKTWMPWGKLNYQPLKLTLGGKKVKLEEVISKDVIFVKAVIRLTKKERSKQAINEDKQKQILKTKSCESYLEAIQARKEKHQKNLATRIKKIEKNIQKKGRTYDAQVFMAAREQGLNLLKVIANVCNKIFFKITPCLHCFALHNTNTLTH